MKDFGVKKNASGYYDEPCYKAATASPRPGEIYLHRKSDQPSLILAENGEYCLCLKLYDLRLDGEICVLARVPMYVNPKKVTYARTADLTQYVKSIPEREFKIIHQAAVRALIGTKED